MVSREVLEFINNNRQQYVDELFAFLGIPSVSTYTHHAADIQKAAQWILERLQRLDFKARICTTKRHPVVYGEYLASSDLPTLLVYGHYDVQPAEPLDEWLTPPFAPTIRDGYVYARGASDDKGQFFTYLKAIEAVLTVQKALPINLKVLVEGEEEIGSPSMEAFLKEHSRELSADFVAISDGSQFARGIPAITYGLRGLSCLQIDLQGPRFDLHSGGFGGLVANPVQILAEILVKLKDHEGRVAIPGFYDDIQDLQRWEREEMASLPFDESQLKTYLGVEQLIGEPGYSPIERRTARPTLDVNGIWGGFSGEGTKTIIPARAGAKVSMRLVPKQNQLKINKLFRDYVSSLTPPDVKLTITDLFGADPVLVSRDEPSIQAAARAIEIGFGKTPVFIREGGSIPIVNLLKESLGMENILLLGRGSPDDGFHSPNERLLLDDFYRGIRSAAALLFELANK